MIAIYFVIGIGIFISCITIFAPNSFYGVKALLKN